MRSLLKVAATACVTSLLVVWGLDGLSALAAGKKPEGTPAGRAVQAPAPAEAPLPADTRDSPGQKLRGNRGTSPNRSVAEAAPAGSGSISGKVSFSGSAPARQKLKMSADPVCLQQHSGEALSQEVVVNNGALQHVLVYVKEGAQGSFPAPTTPVVINQVGCMYEPHVFGIQAGQPLEIRNSDPTLHNINCQAKLNKKFNLAQPQKGMKTTKTFDKEEVGFSFKCNVHPWMSAHAGVFSHPFFAVSKEDGTFSIQGLPAGSYTVEAWHEKLGTQVQKITLAEGESKQVSFGFASK